jgi:molybdopterin molybdotransferase
MELAWVDPVTKAIGDVVDRLTICSAEGLSAREASGRVLAEALRADRDSPAMDVSAMDGYALRLADVQDRLIPVSSSIAAGDPPRSLPPGTAARIFTGGVVPGEAEVVIPREDTLEIDGAVSFRVAADRVRRGQHIRRQGENGQSGDTLFPQGTLLTPARMAAVATFAPARLQVYRPVRVVVLNTGSELIAAGEPAQAWQIRDSNGPLLEAWLQSHRWIELLHRQALADDPDALLSALSYWLPQTDAVLLTGGVSMGDHDYVPEAIVAAGGGIVFHRLPIRPGKPLLAAIGPAGQLICGLPGNPVSVAITARRFAAAWLRRLAGMSPQLESTPLCLASPDDKRLELTWFRLVRQLPDGKLALVDSRGSGDLVSLARSTGFIEVPVGQAGPGPWSYYPWLD